MNSAYHRTIHGSTDLSSACKFDTDSDAHKEVIMGSTDLSSACKFDTDSDAHKEVIMASKNIIICSASDHADHGSTIRLMG